MGTQDRHSAAPIFVVGSPRSGTSILTWCLGQHPNILPTEESDWLGPFAVQVAVHHRRGSVRGERSQLSALGVERDEFFASIGAAVDATIVGHRGRLVELNRAVAERDPAQTCAEFAVARDEAEPKARWVDGTPEYSLHIYGLHKLFPAAKFIHILREPDDVATSLLAFRQGGGTPLVASADEAYAYWERTTQACAQSARALGADVVFRLLHADLVNRPVVALRKVFEFLGEEFSETCVAPLTHRINSSFAAEARPSGVGASMAAAGLVERARHLYAQLSAETVPAVPTAADRHEMERDFEERIDDAAQLRANYLAMRTRLATLLRDPRQEAAWIEMERRVAEKTRQLALARRALLICGIVLAGQSVFALGTYLMQPGPAVAAWLAVSGAGMLVYAWLRRAGLRQLIKGKATVELPSPSHSKEVTS